MTCNKDKYIFRKLSFLLYFTSILVCRPYVRLRCNALTSIGKIVSFGHYLYEQHVLYHFYSFCFRYFPLVVTQIVASLIDAARCVIYDRHMFIVQATGCSAAAALVTENVFINTDTCSL